MKKLIVIAILFALCGFGAFRHFSGQSAIRAKHEQRYATASTETERINRKNHDTEAKLAAGKIAAEEEIKKIFDEELAKARAPHLKTLEDLQKQLAEVKPPEPVEEVAPPVSEARQLADADFAAVIAEIETVKTRLAKLETEQKTLKKYKDAEVAAMPPSRRAKVK